MKKIDTKIWKKGPKGKLFSSVFGDVIHADALEVFDSLRQDSVDVVFLDPPFNLGKQYGSKNKNSDKLREDDYFRFISSILDRANEVLKPGGSLYLYHIPKWSFQFADYLNKKMNFQHWISISMKNGFIRGPRLYPAHYALLHFSKGNPVILNRPKVAIQICRHCGEDVKDYGGYRKYLKKGLNLSDVWDDVSPVRHKHKKHRQQNELPEIILDRILAMSGNRKGVILDAFGGSGTTAVCAKKFGMKFIICDREKEYYNLIIKRTSSKKRG